MSFSDRSSMLKGGREGGGGWGGREGGREEKMEKYSTEHGLAS